MPEKFEKWIGSVVACTRDLVRCTAALTGKDLDLGFHVTTDTKIQKTLTECVSGLSDLTKSTFTSSAIICDTNLPESFVANFNVSMIEKEYEKIVNYFDEWLEKMDSELDQKFSRKTSDKEKVAAVAEKTVKDIEMKTSKGAMLRFFHSQNLGRPQLMFKRKVDNSNSVPFVPLIREKPNALIPIKDYKEIENCILDHREYDSAILLKHPYEFEIDSMTLSPNFLQYSDPIVPVPLSDGIDHFCMVETFEGLERMCMDLEKQDCIAVDLEHHSYRSYQGFVCLMQISTRTKDYIIDCLELREHLHVLNGVFTDPAIVKVLHGADSDVIWLQRDFGVYIVNMFDTYFATKALDLASHSLAFLLKQYCNITTDKSFQLADWRIRPLPNELLLYARQDTHYLLYIYDILRNTLVDQGKLDQVLTESKNLSKKVHVKEVYDEEKALKFCANRKNARVLDDRQMKILKFLHKWRDDIARSEDESVGFVLPNHMLFRMAEMIPTKANEVMACCEPVPTFIRLHANDLAIMISQLKTEMTVVAKGPTIESPGNVAKMADKPSTAKRQHSAIFEKLCLPKPKVPKTMANEVVGQSIIEELYPSILNNDNKSDDKKTNNDDNKITNTIDKKTVNQSSIRESISIESFMKPVVGKPTPKKPKTPVASDDKISVNYEILNLKKEPAKEVFKFTGKKSKK